MVTHEVLRLSSAQGEGLTLNLAPFGSEEFTRVSPLDPELMTFLPVKSQEAYAEGPDRVLELESQLDHTDIEVRAVDGA